MAPTEPTLMEGHSVVYNIDELRALERRPRVHPNGFIQLDLTEPVDKARGHGGAPRRLHIWPDEGVLEGQDSDSPIHDHVFDMESSVQRGSLVQIRYTFKLEHYSLPTHEVWLPNYLNASESVLAPTGVLGSLASDIYTQTVGAGESYQQAAFTFHETQPAHTPVVTIMTKTKSYDNFDARVLVPLNSPPDNDFRREQYDESFLWEIIEESTR